MYLAARTATASADSDCSNETRTVEGILGLESPMSLAHGGSLPEVDLAYRLAGPENSPVVLCMGGISADRFVSADEINPGWWQEYAGPGRAIDTESYQILSFDWLGGAGDSTRANGSDFPLIDTRDQATAVIALLDHLDIDCLEAVIGASYGGLVAQQLARHYPQRLHSALVIAAGYQPQPMATAWRSVQRKILRFGIRLGDHQGALELARALAMSSYRSNTEFGRRFNSSHQLVDGQPTFEVEQYLFHCGQQFAKRFDVWPYLRLSESIDLHRVEPEKISVPLSLVGFSSDQLAPPEDLRQFKLRCGRQCRLWILESDYGHDSFLKPSPVLANILGRQLESVQ
jgi:homoserine O-acetyltransferase